MSSTRNPIAGQFVVILDDTQEKLDGWSPTNDTECAYTWSKTGLPPGLHNLTVAVVGPSPNAPNTAGIFELNKLLLVGEDRSPLKKSKALSDQHSFSTTQILMQCFSFGLVGLGLLGGF